MLDLRPAQGPRLVLQLSARDDEGLEVRVTESPVGEAVSAKAVLQRIDDVLRMVSQPTFHEDVGRGLFRTLFPGPLGELYRAAFTHAAMAGQMLTVELRFDHDLVRIARYPWELLHDGTRFLLQSGAINLSRYLSFPEPPRPLTPRGPLEILVVSARPKDQAPLTSEFDALQKAFQPLVQADKLDLAYLLPPTWDSLMDWLLAGAPGVLHFEGHGAFTRTGLLVFEDADGDSDPVDAATLGNAFYGTDLRLAVLSACESSRAGGESLLSSVAPTLIMAGIPAVVAMQQSLPDEAALRFSRGFYNALLAGQDIESAVAAGRKQLIRTTFWHVPTLYLRTHKTPSIQRAYLERRVDTAGPRRAPVNQTFRFGVWIRRPDAPKPSDDELRRLLGIEPQAPVTRDSTRAPVMFPVELGQIQPGTVEVHLTAHHCDIHTPPTRRVSVFPDFDTPALWYALTPRQPGRLDVIIELAQGGALIASVAHTIEITQGAEGEPVASVKSYGEQAQPPQIDVIPKEAEEIPAAQPPEDSFYMGDFEGADKKEAPREPDEPSPEAEDLPDWLSESVDTDEALDIPDWLSETMTEAPFDDVPDIPAPSAPVAASRERRRPDVLHKYDTNTARYGATLSVHVTPGADRRRITGMREDGAIQVQVTGASTGEQANVQIAGLFVDLLGTGRDQIEVVEGAQLPDKVISIDGVTLIDTVKTLSAHLGQRPPATLSRQRVVFARGRVIILLLVLIILVLSAVGVVLLLG